MTEKTITLAPDVVAEIVEKTATRIVELLSEPSSGQGLVDALTVARTLGVSRDYVYSHAQELGGKRVGSGPRGRLRFDLRDVLDGWTSRSASKASGEARSHLPTGNARGRRQGRTGSGAELLPIKRAQARSAGSRARS